MRDSFSPHRERLALIAALLSVYVIWGSTYLAIRIALAGLPPFLMAGVRFVVAGIILFAVLWLRGAPAPSPRQWGNAALIGGLLLVGGNGGVVVAEQTVASGLAALAVATVALWAALFAGLWGQWPKRLEWAGLAVGFAGVALLNVGGGLRASPVGALALVVGPVSWALGSMWSRRLDLPSGLMASAAEMIVGGMMLLAVSRAAGERAPRALAVRPLVALVYLIVFGSWIGFSAYLYLLRHARPAIATSYAYVNPIVALGLGVVLGGEHIEAGEWAATPVILAGVALLAVAHGRSRAGSASPTSPPAPTGDGDDPRERK